MRGDSAASPDSAFLTPSSAVFDQSCTKPALSARLVQSPRIWVQSSHSLSSEGLHRSKIYRRQEMYWFEASLWPGRNDSCINDWLIDFYRPVLVLWISKPVCLPISFYLLTQWKKKPRRLLILDGFFVFAVLHICVDHTQTGSISTAAAQFAFNWSFSRFLDNVTQYFSKASYMFFNLTQPLLKLDKDSVLW